MQPKTLSASAALVFEGCEARYKAEYIDRTPDIDGTAAALGTSCHEALEHWVANGHHLANDPFDRLVAYFDPAYAQLFSTPERYDEGVGLLRTWYDRQDWKGRTVLSTEKKETFDLTATHPTLGKVSIPFTYIWDRCDRWDDGTIEVVDYKSVALPIQPEDLKQRIQPRSYALAAQMKYPDAKRILVSYDLLRYDVVGTFFTREENIATWKYLQQLFLRVLDSDGTRESLNPECRWCVRKPACETLTRHAAGGGILGIDDPEVAASRRAQLDAAQKAIRGMVDDLDAYLLDYLEQQGELEMTTADVHVKVSARGTRKVESERAAKVLGPELMTRYGSLGVTQIDKILKDEPLTEAQKSELKQLIRKEFGKPYIQTKPVGPVDDGD